jgi:Uma2 family endonuclease
MMMPSPQRKPPESMGVCEFLSWPGDGSGRKFQLVDGEVRAMSPASAAHGSIQADLAYMLRHHMITQHKSCRVVAEPAIATRVRASINLRVPDIGVSCTPAAPGEQTLPDPVALIEILSPGNASDTWENVWSYTTIPTVREIVVIHSTRIFAELLRRDADGNWPEQPEEIGTEGTLRLQSIDFSCPLAAAYAQTHLANRGP